jgi:uncharacterized Zn-binding protein involved in type VI secretion
LNGLVPHVGGSVAVGSATVLIGGQPAARQGDIVMEAAPPEHDRGRCSDVTIGG